MTKTFGLISSLAALSLAVAAAMLSVPGRSERVYPGVHAFLANRVVPAMNTVSGSIAEQSQEMAPP